MRPRLLTALLLLTAASAAAQSLPAPCKAIDQSISVVAVYNPGEVQGQELLMLQLWNGGETCSLNGIPALDFSAGSEHRYTAKLIPLTVDEAPTDSTEPAAAGPVILKHAELAQLRITWSSLRHGSCRNLDALRIALPGDAPLTEIIFLHTHVCGALHLSHFAWGWVHQSNILRASWNAGATPADPVPYTPATGPIWGDRFNGIAMSIKTDEESYPLGAAITLSSRVKNYFAPRTPVIGDYPYRWLSMRESNGHTVLCSLGTAPPSDAGGGEPVPHNQAVDLPNLDLSELDMLPALIGHVTYALSAEFWPSQTNAHGIADNNAMGYAPTAVVSNRLTLNFTQNK